MASTIQVLVVVFMLGFALGAYPTIEVVNGNLTFITNAVGSRIGYEYRDEVIRAPPSLRSFLKVF